MTTPIADDSHYYNVEQLAVHLGVSAHTIHKWRALGTAPHAHKFGRHLRFARKDVAEWEAQRREVSA